MNKFLRSLILMVLGFGQIAMAQSVITIKDGDLQANQTYNWTSNNVYLLDGFVYLETGGKLIIEPGTVIKGKTVPTTGDLSSSLIITRGAQIFAEGTATRPIIFTGELDDLSTTTDILASDNQLWGGLIILGSAPIGEDGGTDVIEGIPSSEPRIVYGGTNANDNSGILRYVSVRHGGSVLGADNEINGITLGGVGRGTTIDYVEVFANKDDGIEVFGGTVNITHALVSFVGDDSFDFDESWDGYVQFLFSIQDGITNGDNAIEYDGSEEANRQPKTVGRIYNGTFIGSGSVAGTDSDGLRLRLDGAAQFWNCIWTQIPGAVFRVEDTSRDRLRTGESAFRGNIAVQYGTLAFGNDPIILSAWINNDNGVVTNPQLGSISRIPDGNLDPRPQAASAALTGAAVPSEAGVQAVPYRGAFSNVENWATGWSALAQYGYFGNKVTIDKVINDARIQAGQAWVLNNEVEWILDGLVYVEAGASLTIEPGTVIKAKNVPTSSADISSSLIIARGAKIFAEGTRTQPIIFTSELDDLSTTTDLTANDRRLWGGVIVLGAAPVGEDGGTDVY
ncbi:MAG: T9SS C-terminal target domain-containing protein [Saprospiraceae bacterium]|nr:T9SS C-terminal target domain-containing protein [Saprospiraceae bacterium]